MRLSRCLKIRRSVFAPFAAAIAFLMPAVTEAQGGPGEDPVVKIEEDWIAMVSESDAEVSAPQMATTFVPDAAVPDQQFSLLLNQHQSPEPEGGGMQVVWNEGEATPYLSVPSPRPSHSCGRGPARPHPGPLPLVWEREKKMCDFRGRSVHLPSPTLRERGRG